MHKSLSTEADIFVKVFLLKRIRHSHCVVLKGPQVAYAACVSLPNSCDVKQLGRSPIWRLERLPRRPEVAAYTAPDFCVNTLFSTFCRAISANRKDPDFEPKSHPEPFDRPRMVRHFREAPVSTDQTSPRQHRFSPKLQKRLHMQLSVFLATQSR